MDLYTRNALHCSKITTKNYSTSFSMGVQVLAKTYRDAIYAIYGFVRFADEIVDTFHEHDKRLLLNDFRNETYDAINRKLSNNPILHSFQWVVNKYKIDGDLIDAFLDSMAMDISKKYYQQKEFEEYVYGSAEVVGLMCLKVFYSEDTKTYKQLLPQARKLGEAFQKVNFLRDLRADYLERGRIYFPNIDFKEFSEDEKKQIEKNIQQDFDAALEGIKQLKSEVRIGVYLAYSYYLQLFKKIKNTPANQIIKKRYRISNGKKLLLMVACSVRNKFNLI